MPFAKPNIKEIGRVKAFRFGAAKLTGLPHVFLHEVLIDEQGTPRALVVGFDEHGVEALGFEETYDPNRPLFRSGRLFSLPASAGFSGRVVDGFGRPRDGLGPVGGELKPVFRDAPGVIERAPVRHFLPTGIKVVDSTLPLGRGQRELIIGDRKLGKSTLALDIVLNQKDSDPPVWCVYVVCGQPARQLQDFVRLLQQAGAMAYTTVVAAPAGDGLAAQYLAPFVGAAIGEYFRDRGEHALVVFDDLTQHAKCYRDISLLLDRAPGRESYPGDIFSLHAGLLERAAQLAGGGSLTALPIVETQEGDITSFIPTNLISITDGQIYLERGLYQKGFLPAVNVGLSVSRVGAQVQPETFKAATGRLRLTLAQHKDLQKLAQLETVVSRQTEKRIRHGELILELLKQPAHRLIPWEAQVVLFYAVEYGFFDDLEKDAWPRFEHLLIDLILQRYPDTLAAARRAAFDRKFKDRLQALVTDFKKEFLSA